MGALAHKPHFEALSQSGTGCFEALRQSGTGYFYPRLVPLIIKNVGTDTCGYLLTYKYCIRKIALLCKTNIHKSGTETHQTLDPNGY